MDGEPFWNGVHKAWWVKPSVPEIVAAFEQAYTERDKADRAGLRGFASEYAVDAVADRFMKPAVDELLGRMAARKGQQMTPEENLALFEEIKGQVPGANQNANTRMSSQFSGDVGRVLRTTFHAPMPAGAAH